MSGHLLMCSPQHFEVTYEINLWMQPETWKMNPVELRSTAQKSWQGLYKTFQSLGIKIDLIHQQPTLPDMVFTANSAIVLNGRVLLSKFRHKERQGEEKHFAQYFNLLKDKGIVEEVVELPEPYIQEGAGDCMWDAQRKLFWAGYGPRSTKESTEYVQQFFGKEVIALELGNPKFYHVDISLSPLSHGEILYYPEAFTEEGRNIIRERVPPEQLIEIDQEDASYFVCNLVNIQNTIVLSKCSLLLKDVLRDRGYSVIEAPVETFGLAGGSVCCLTLRLDWTTN